MNYNGKVTLWSEDRGTYEAPAKINSRTIAVAKARYDRMNGRKLSHSGFLNGDRVLLAYKKDGEEVVVFREPPAHGPA